jgi:hypothetical protein
VHYGFFHQGKGAWQVAIMIKSSWRLTRCLFNSEFKVKVVLAVLREDKHLAKLYQQFELHPRQIT